MKNREESIEHFKQEFPEDVVKLLVEHMDSMETVYAKLHLIHFQTMAIMHKISQREDLDDLKKNMLALYFYSPMRELRSFIQSDGCDAEIKGIYQDLEDLYAEALAENQS